MKQEDISQKTNKFVGFVKSIKKELIDILLEYESYETACHEIDRTLKCLNNIKTEEKYLIYGNVNSISTFFPLNLPLYSLVLFAIVPSFMAKNVFVRPPILMQEILGKISKRLNLSQHFPGIHILRAERRLFVDGYASVSDVIIFTGKFKNALHVKKRCPFSLFIYNGAGINPIIVSQNADINIAAQKTLEMRVFNSGQDCAGPDAILVDEKILSIFLEKLFKLLDKIKVGNYKNRNVRIGKFIDQERIPSIEKLFNRFKKSIVYGGKIDHKNLITYPTVILNNLKNNQFKYIEFFAPIFNIFPYNSDKQLDSFFQDKKYLRNAMYVSIFGNLDYIEKIKKSVIIKNKIVNDVEEGNKAYGGYGECANFINYGNKFSYRPILISKEIHDYLVYLKTKKIKIP
ncbi:MAG: aldehyde dehydrogenase family protein [Patescibacteria group bacterium]|nr:aldehyde dehydrogenase family protein [Patescibacteria group bacterium]